MYRAPDKQLPKDWRVDQAGALKWEPDQRPTASPSIACMPKPNTLYSRVLLNST